MLPGCYAKFLVVALRGDLVNDKLMPYVLTSFVIHNTRYKIPLVKGLLLTENLALQNHNKTELIDIQLATFKNCEHGEFLLDQLSCRRNPR